MAMHTIYKRLSRDAGPICLQQHIEVWPEGELASCLWESMQQALGHVRLEAWYCQRDADCQIDGEEGDAPANHGLHFCSVHHLQACM